MVHDHVGDEFYDFALDHAWKVYNCLPVKSLEKDLKSLKGKLVAVQTKKERLIDKIADDIISAEPVFFSALTNGLKVMTVMAISNLIGFIEYPLAIDVCRYSHRLWLSSLYASS